MKRVLLGLCFAALLAHAIIGCVSVSQPGDAVAALSARFLKADELELACDGAVVKAQDHLTTVRWEANARTLLTAISRPMPLDAAADGVMQLDLNVGGTRNAVGHMREGYRVWIELRVLDADGEALAVKREEAPLESVKERARLYSLIAPVPAQAHAWQLALCVEAEGEALAAGYLSCSYVEVRRP